MRRLSLTLLLLAAPVLAQEAAEPPAAPAAEPEAPAPEAAQEAAPAAPEQAPAAEEPGPAQAAPPRRKRRPKPAPKPAARVVKPAPPPKAPEPKAPEPRAPEPEAAPATAAAPAPASPAPEPSTPGKLGARERVAEEARVFFSLLLTGDVRALSYRLDFPFQLEGRRFGDNEALVSEWVRSLRQRRTDLVTLYDLEVLTPEEMERKHGAPPKRLGTLDYRAPDTFVAVANLSGRAAVAIFRITGGSVKAVAYTD